MGLVMSLLAYVTGGVAVALALLLSGVLNRWDVPNKLLMLAVPYSKDAAALVGAAPLVMTRAQLEHGFKYADVPEGHLAGKVAIVTGANSGVGFWTAYHLARAGCTVVVGCRNAERCKEAIAKMEALPGGKNGRLVPGQLDTSSLASVKQFADTFCAAVLSGGRLDILVLNAGISLSPEGARTKCGVEMTFATNVLGHHLLQKLLREKLAKTAAENEASGRKGLSRVVFISSAAHTQAPLRSMRAELTTLEGCNGGLAKDRYALTKLANIFQARELAKRLPNVLVNAAHPGAVDTDIYNELTDTLREKLPSGIGAIVVGIFQAIRFKLMWKSDLGALTQVYLAASPKLTETGKYFVPIAQEFPAAEFARGPEGDRLAQDSWAFNEQLIAERGY